jgi:hypothetical protein
MDLLKKARQEDLSPAAVVESKLNDHRQAHQESGFGNRDSADLR